MSDDATQQEAVEVEKVEADSPKTYDEAYVKELRDENAKARIERKKLEAELKELQDRDKSEADKAAERLAELERENAEFKKAIERAEWLRDASAETGLPLEALELIQGDDRESFLGAAQKIKSLIPEVKTIIPGDAEQSALPLNGDGIENALRKALGIN